MRPLNISFAAIERILDEKAQRDPTYAASLEKKGHLRLRNARALPDHELQVLLADTIGPVTKERLAALTRGHDSAESVARAWISQAGQRIAPAAEDALWCALTVLWERWQPETPSFEMLDDRMQEGYRLNGLGDETAACDVWLALWRAFARICEARKIDGLEALDARFQGSQSVFNWVQDLELELWNAGLKDPRYLRERIELCRDVLARFRDLDRRMVSSFRSAIAESLAELRDTKAANAEFLALTRANPSDGWLWVRWARAFERSDSHAVAEVLERGMAVPGLQNRKKLLEAAVWLGEKFGLEALVERARRELTAAPPEASADSRGQKVGRNDPCPCGSGKKFKKCCLARDAGGLIADR